jgi:hypothetical protein
VGNTLQRRSNGLVYKFTSEEKEERKEQLGEEWPGSNKRKYLKNYLPKISSPIKYKKEEKSKYDEDTT